VIIDPAATTNTATYLESSQVVLSGGSALDSPGELMTRKTKTAGVFG